jgi:curli biogenesis system outer membrane secretion channel CsgG
MSRIPGIAAVIAGSFVLAGTAGLTARQAPAPSVAVVGFVVDSASKLSSKTTDAMTDKLATDLVESGGFRVLDREWLGPEAVSGPRLPLARIRDAANAAGVDYLVVGQVSKFSERQSYGTPGPRVFRPFGQPFARFATAAPRKAPRRFDYLRVSLEIVETKTGVVLTETSSTCPAPPKSAPAVPPLVLLPVSPIAAAAAAIAHANREASSLNPGIARALTTAGQVIARWRPAPSAGK